MYSLIAPTQQGAMTQSLSFLPPKLLNLRQTPPSSGALLCGAASRFPVLEVCAAGFDPSAQKVYQLALSNVRSLQSLLFLDHSKKIRKLTKSPPSVGMRIFISEDLALTISQSREFLLR